MGANSQMLVNKQYRHQKPYCTSIYSLWEIFHISKPFCCKKKWKSAYV